MPGGSTSNSLVSIADFSHDETMIAPPIAALWAVLGERKHRMFAMKSCRAVLHRVRFTRVIYLLITIFVIWVVFIRANANVNAYIGPCT